MADYPTGVYTPRTRENKSGVVYDANKKTVIYVEDINKTDDEVVAIETDLVSKKDSLIAPLSAVVAEAVVAGQIVEVYQDGGAKIRGARDVIGPMIDSGDAVISPLKVTPISTNKWLCVYVNAGDSNHIYAKIMTLSAGVLSFGDAVEVKNATVTSFQSFRVSDSNAFVYWYSATDSYYFTGVSLAISGSVLTVGTPLSLNIGQYIGVQGACGIGTAKFVIGYKDASSHPQVKCGTIADGIVTFGSGIELEAAALTVASVNMWFAPLADDAFFIARNMSASSGTLKIDSITASGTTLTAGTGVTLYTSSGGAVRIKTDFDYSLWVTGLASGVYRMDCLYVEAGYAETAGYLSLPDVYSIKSFLTLGFVGDYMENYIVFKKSSTDDKFYLKHTYTEDGFTIAEYDDEKTITSGDISTLNMIQIANEVPPALSSDPASPYNLVVFVFDVTRDFKQWTGIMTEAGSIGETKTLNLPSTKNTHQSGLLAGQRYYVDYTGSLTTIDTGVLAGIAISTTEILVLRNN